MTYVDNDYPIYHDNHYREDEIIYYPDPDDDDEFSEDFEWDDTVGY